MFQQGQNEGQGNFGGQEHGHMVPVIVTNAPFNRFQSRLNSRGNHQYWNGNGRYRGNHESGTEFGPQHRQNVPCERYNPDYRRPWNNHYSRPRFFNNHPPEAVWVRPPPQLQQQYYANQADRAGLILQMEHQPPPYRPFGPRFTPYQSAGEFGQGHAVPRSGDFKRYSFHSLPLRRPTLKAHVDDEEYCPEPVKRPVYYFNRLGNSNCSLNSLNNNESLRSSSSSSDSSDLSNASSISVEDDHSNESSSASTVSIVRSSPSSSFDYVSSTSESSEQEESPFFELYLVASTNLIRDASGQAGMRASFGVWNLEGEWNFAERVPKDRPQCLKAALIFGSGKVIRLMKEKGFYRLRINTESDYIIKNVQSWINKYMTDACNGLELTNFSNWDELKYAAEIKQLCLAFQDTIVKWTLVSSQQDGVKAAKVLAKDLLTST